MSFNSFLILIVSKPSLFHELQNVLKWTPLRFWLKYVLFYGLQTENERSLLAVQMIDFLFRYAQLYRFVDRDTVTFRTSRAGRKEVLQISSAQSAQASCFSWSSQLESTIFSPESSKSLGSSVGFTCSFSRYLLFSTVIYELWCSEETNYCSVQTRSVCTVSLWFNSIFKVNFYESSTS